MSDETTPVGTPAPAVVPVVAAPVVAAAPAPAPVATPPAPPAPDTAEPAWLPDRLARAKNSAREAILQELGVTNPDEAKAAIAAAKAAADAKKTAEERAAEYAQQVNALKTTTERQAAYAKEMAGRMLMALSPEQQKAVTDFAGDDPMKQFEAIKHFGPTWAAIEQAKIDAAKTAEPLKPAAQTSPAPGAPAGETPVSSDDPKTVYQAQRATNPFAAAAYGLSHSTVYNS